MIVGLVGFIGSGKGAAGEILSELGFEKQSFAGPVKDVTSVMFGWPRQLLEGDTEESREFRERPDKFWSAKFGRPFTPREALQKMGTEVGRQTFHQNFWIDTMDHKVFPGYNYVITDVRFQNEMKWVNQHDGVIIEINRGERPQWYDIAMKANEGYVKAETYMLRESGIHESEWRWINSNIEAKIENNGTLVELRDNLIVELKKFYGSSTIDEIVNGVNNATVE